MVSTGGENGEKMVERERDAPGEAEKGVAVGDGGGA